MKEKIFVFGASGHAKVVIDVIEKQALYEIAFLVDDDLSLKGTDFFGYPVSIFGDTIVVGASYNDDDGIQSGSAYVFEKLAPVEITAAIIDKVITFNLQQGFENALDAKLDAALVALSDVNERNNVAAIGSLNVLINAIEAQQDHR